MEASSIEAPTIDSLGLQNDYKGIISLMKAAPSDISIQMSGCFYLSCIAADPSARKLMSGSGAVEAILAAMAVETSHQELQTQGLSAIKALAVDSVICTKLGSSGACSAILEAMTANPRAEDVLTSGLKALSILAKPEGLEKITFLKLKADVIILEIIKEYEEEASVIVGALEALSALAFKDHQTALRLGNVGACGPVCQSLKRFPRDLSVQLAGANAVYNLAVVKDNRKLLVDQGALTLLLVLLSPATSSTSCSDPKLLLEGLQALYQLCEHDGYSKAEALRLNLVPALFTLLQRLRSSRSLIEQTVRTLRAIVELDGNAATKTDKTAIDYPAGPAVLIDLYGQSETREEILINICIIFRSTAKLGFSSLPSFPSDKAKFCSLVKASLKAHSNCQYLARECHLLATT